MWEACGSGRAIPSLFFGGFLLGWVSPSLNVSFWEISWFDVREETQRFDWPETRLFLCALPGIILTFQAIGSLKPITALYLPPYINYGISLKRQV